MKNKTTVNISISSTNSIIVNIPQSIYTYLEEPKELFFDEINKIIRIGMLDDDTNKILCNRSKTNVHHLFITKIKYSDIDTFIGKWNYQLDDLSVMLIEKIK